MFLAQVANTIAKSRLQIFGAVEPDAGLAGNLQLPNSEHEKNQTTAATHHSDLRGFMNGSSL